MRALITGGAGFVGSNLASRLLRAGHEVTILDNFSRPGVGANARWLSEKGGTHLAVVPADVRDPVALRSAVSGKTAIFHLASQVAVTTSVADPMNDFDVNLRGTVNVLEAVRAAAPEACLLFTSTNKVYGQLEHYGVVEHESRYGYADPGRGVGVSQPLDFHSPYGCSKGAADQYVRDYARVYGLHTVVFRMSCIYGPRQFGTEDQGWVAHFLISALLKRPVTIYGNGKQVRDVLFVEDLLDAFLAAVDRGEEVGGEIFNIGGGCENTISVLELIDWIREETGEELSYTHAPWRVGDQRVYVSDTSKARETLAWSPRVSVPQGLGRLWSWAKRHQDLFCMPPPVTVRR